MKVLLAITLLLESMASHSEECVILLHGLARTASSMSDIEERLTDEGYKVVNVDYPSRDGTIEELAELAVSEGLAHCNSAESSSIHFVTHSMGGILVRQYLSQNTIEKLGRTVMLGPPNQGSEVVDKLGEMPGFEFINGPAGMQLGTGTHDVPQSLGPANFEVGIIAGTRSINLILSVLIPDTDDGKVSLESAHLENETDFIEMPVTHPFMMHNEEVIDNVVHFLKNGVFMDSQV
ncbi:alpha/beta fold hydrolase [Pseudohongiella sp. SYSU M77423]|uniref:alpha/beta fold hydrolase n=1 Tax=Pseudohongiella sp. SYSU M77423 TaxID=3042312 RepID=UPI002481029B|nr:alpha/beta fold hydrolase [Pseudohongiella sp. SYSU M77423]MDH7942931.1 alpha/beta fold hydrolase [Pseudohongiella sp. SYSU M77423]MEC8860677.1 alpha/beta fold hydrolase [Pseudomonadota bacterium]